MKKLIAALLFLFACGCVSVGPEKNEVLSGTSVTIGLWLPINGTLYGLQAFNYLSGTKITSSGTNACDIAYSHSATNSGFGASSAISKDLTVKQ